MCDLQRVYDIDIKQRFLRFIHHLFYLHQARFPILQSASVFQLCQLLSDSPGETI